MVAKKAYLMVGDVILTYSDGVQQSIHVDGPVKSIDRKHAENLVLARLRRKYYAAKAVWQSPPKVREYVQQEMFNRDSYDPSLAQKSNHYIEY